MSDTSLAFTPAWQLKELIQARQLSPVELIDCLLERIERLNPKLNAYLTVCPNEAREAAKLAEKTLMRRLRLPPLHGLPVSIKDLIFTKGIRTTGGSLVHKDFVPDEDAPVVQRLRQAGAIILGKTNTSEFGQSTTTENRLGDDCRNPWNTGRTPGGSSGGAGAAAAAGLGALALGSDAGGSIRVPSSFCGIYGLKPTWGRVPQWGHFGGIPTFSQVGPMTRSVQDAALLLEVIAGPEPRDPYSLRETPPRLLRQLGRGVEGLRIAWSPNLGYATIDPEVQTATTIAVRAFEGLGCDVEEMPIKLENPFPIFTPIALADVYQAYGDLLESHAEDLVHYVRLTLERGRELPAYQYSQALQAKASLQAKIADLFERYDLLLTPTTAVPTFPIGQRPRVIDGKPVDKIWGAFPLTLIANLAGLPAASLPCGYSSDGLPIGLQIIGRFREESTILRASAAFEASRPWADKTPPGFSA